jgi:hypothetical protein
MFHPDNKCREEALADRENSKINIFFFKSPSCRVEQRRARKILSAAVELNVGCLKNGITFITIICFFISLYREGRNVELEKCFKDFRRIESLFFNDFDFDKQVSWRKYFSDEVKSHESKICFSIDCNNPRKIDNK